MCLAWIALAGCDAQITGYPTSRAPLQRASDGGSIRLMPGYDGGEFVPPAADAGTTAPSGSPGGNPASVTPYPTGPFGVEAGEVMQSYQFQRADGAMTQLADLRADPSVKVIVWVSSVEWCTYCRAQVPLLNQISQMPGVRVVSSLYETQSYSPATTATANSWKSSLGCNYDVIVEQNPPHTPHSVNPTAWIIDAETMQIRDRFNGEEPQLMSRVQTAVNGARR